MNLLLGLPFLAVAFGLLLPLILFDGGPAYLTCLWLNPRLASALVLNLGVMSYWLARRLSQALLRSAGAKLRASDEPA